MDMDKLKAAIGKYKAAKDTDMILVQKSWVIGAIQEYIDLERKYEELIRRIKERAKEGRDES